MHAKQEYADQEQMLDALMVKNITPADVSTDHGTVLFYHGYYLSGSSSKRKEGCIAQLVLLR